MDGGYKGKTPFTINQVSPGSHTIKLTLSQFDDWTSSVNVVEGSTNTVTAILSKKNTIQNPTPTPTITPTYTNIIPSPTPTVFDINPPSISLGKQIVEFNKNGQLEEGEKLDITYGATDKSGVKSIKVLLDGNLIDLRNNQGTFHIITDSLSMGDHSIVVEAIDSKGNKNSEKMNIYAARLGPSVYFPKSRYEVVEGDDFILVLSAVNPIGNPKMEILLVIKPPGNGVSIYEGQCKGLKGMCTGKYEIEPGDIIRSISIKMRADKAGEYPIDAEIYYQFEGGQRSPTQYETLSLVVKSKQTPNPINTQAPSTPGFELLSGVFGLLFIMLIRGCNKFFK